MRLWGNDYNKMEFAGAFGDLGTLIPFVVGYITINKMDPLGILVAFGLFKIFAGLYFRTPVPIQPMKAIGGMAISHPGLITPGMIWGSGIFTGIFWLLMGLTGAITWILVAKTSIMIKGAGGKPLRLVICSMVLVMKRIEVTSSTKAAKKAACIIRNITRKYGRSPTSLKRVLTR